jgi:hypothetical protein
LNFDREASKLKYVLLAACSLTLKISLNGQSYIGELGKYSHVHSPLFLDGLNLVPLDSEFRGLPKN